MTSLPQNDRAEHILYRTYFGLCLKDILLANGFKEHEITQELKDILHEFHKRVLGYKTIENQSHEVVSMFVQQVCLLWAEQRGIFVRTSKRQPRLIQWMPLSDCWEML